MQPDHSPSFIVHHTLNPGYVKTCQTWFIMLSISVSLADFIQFLKDDLIEKTNNPWKSLQFFKVGLLLSPELP